MKKYLALFFVWASLLAGMAQPSCQVRMFSLLDGLASNSISSIGQTDDQLMWFSTWNGLSCYDGYSFENFSDRQGRERALTTNRLLRVVTSELGNVWCLTYDRQAFLFDRRESRFINVSALVSLASGMQFDCQRIVTLPGGIVWLFSRERNQSCFRLDERALLKRQDKSCVQEYNKDNGLLKGSDVYGVENDEQGREWLLTDGGATLVGEQLKSSVPYCFIRQTGKQVVFATKDAKLGYYDEGRKDIVPLANVPQGVTQVSSLGRVDDRLLVMLTNQGLLFYDTSKSRLQLMPVAQAADIQYIYADQRQRLWALLRKGGALLMTPASGQTELISTAGKIPVLKQSTRYLVHEDRYGTCWLGTEEGFFGYFDEQSRQFVPRTIRATAAQPSIDRFFSDNRHDLWIAGENNVAVINFVQQIFNQVTPDGMQQVRSLCYDSQNRLWVGDMAGHVAVMDKDNRLVGYLGTDGRLHPQQTLFSTHIYCLYEDSRHRMWIGTKGHGLFCLTADGRVSHYEHQDAQPYSLCSNQIYAVHEDLQKRIWVGTFERGISLFDETEGEPRFIHVGNQLKNYPVDDYHKVRRITETADGAIIVSASNGLVAFSEQFSSPADIKFFAHKYIPGDTTSLLTSDVMHTYIDHTGRIFVATVGGGMQEIADKNPLQQHLRLSTINNLDSDLGTVLSMQEDREGNLWIGRENSLVMHEADLDRLWRFGPSNLGEHTEFTEAQPAFNKQTGQMAFATISGYVSFQPEQLGQEDFVPPIVFESVYFHGSQQRVNALFADSLDVPASQRNLTIHFAALDYQDNYMIRYAYRLEGVDHEWNDLQENHSISFSNLPHGHHRLLVRSTNQYGSWVDNVKTLYIYVHPTFWETWWAKLLYVLLALGVVAVAVWIYQLRTRAEKERQQSRMLSLLLTEMTQRQEAETAQQRQEKPAEEQLSEQEQDVRPAESENVLRLRPTDIVDSDKQMMERLLTFIEDNISNPDLKVEDLAAGVCLGRTVFYTKVKSLVGMNPVELLRHVRIQHAEDMVAKSNEPFSQIAYAVGFSDARYFGKCFKKQTGLTPSEYRERSNSAVLLSQTENS